MTYSGTSMLTVLTLDLASDLRVDDSIAVVGDGQTVYGTGSSFYIGDDHRGMPMPIDMRAFPPLGQEQTEIHMFDTSAPGKPEYVASGAVDGWLLNQYSISEHDGYLRVATTRDGSSTITGPAGAPTESQVAVLERQGGQLVEVGSVGGLGKGEQIYAVRFIGPVGYVVTFRQVDPLYTLDLSDPRSPRVVGELKIAGYSAYLHSAGDARLIGVGQDADEQGMTRGAQVSLFDVGDPAAPARLDILPDAGRVVRRRARPARIPVSPANSSSSSPCGGTAECCQRPRRTMRSRLSPLLVERSSCESTVTPSSRSAR